MPDSPGPFPSGLWPRGPAHRQQSWQGGRPHSHQHLSSAGSVCGCGQGAAWDQAKDQGSGWAGVKLSEGRSLPTLCKPSTPQLAHCLDSDTSPLGAQGLSSGSLLCLPSPWLDLSCVPSRQLCWIPRSLCPGHCLATAKEREGKSSSLQARPRCASRNQQGRPASQGTCPSSRETRSVGYLRAPPCPPQPP